MGRIAFGAIVAAGLLGLFVLVVGWLLDVGVARTLIPGSNATKANAALGVVLLAAAMILERGPGSRIRRWIADGCCLTSAGLGAAALIEYAINVDLGIDELLVADKASAHDLPMPGMMAAPTAACFVLLGVAILLRRRWGRQRPWMWQVLAIAVTVLSFVILLGHLYGASAFYALSVPTRTAAPAAIMLALIGAAMLLEGPFVGIMEPSVSSGPGGMLVRRFLPIVLVGVPTVGWFVLEGENRGFYRGPVGHALAATVATLTLSAVIIGVALSLNRVDAARAEKAEAFQAITDSAQDAIVSCDRRGGIVYVNEAGARMFEHHTSELIGRPVTVLVPERFRVAHSDGMARFLATDEPRVIGNTAELVGRRKDGSEFPIELSLSTWRATGEPFFTAIVRDVSERKKLEEALEHRALHDPLTGLANRVLLTDRFDQALRRTARAPHGVGVLFVDLDAFKLVNDTRGHTVGDKVLAELANRLAAAVRPADTVARLGGDEFIVLFEDDATIQSAATLAERILAVLRVPLSSLDGEQCVTASIGIAFSESGNVDSSTLIHKADRAMYRVKAHGGDGYEMDTAERLEGSGLAARMLVD